MKNRNSLYLGVGLAAALLVLFSCSFFESLKGAKTVRENVFSHKAHVVENEMACTDCHEGAMEKDRAGMPEISLCLDCHEDPEKGSTVEKAVLILNQRKKAGKALWQMVHKEGELLFSHKTHAKMKGLVPKGKETACAACHGPVGQKSALGSWVVAEMKSCMACHEKGFTPAVPAKAKGKEIAAKTGKQMTDCAYCHREWRRDRAPAEHRKLWRITHGEQIRFGFDDEQLYYCRLCHDEDVCVNCHMVEKPRSHTAHFRLRGHGIQAEIERERCTTCHKQDYCIRCHEDTRPRSHTVSWGRAPYRHCTNCHLGGSMGANCGVCHKGSFSGIAAAHMAPQYPKDMTHAGNCTMQCHTSRHPDPDPNNCKVCHK